MVHKFRAGKFDLRIVVTIWPETGMKDSFERMEQISVWNIPSGKTGPDFLFGCSIAPQNFLAGTRFSRKFL